MTSISIWLYALFAVLQIADALLTLRILSAGGVELNPVMRWVFRRVGVATGLATVKLLLLVLVFALLPWLPVWLLALACVFYGGVVAHNWIQVRR